ncbi:hypothetical protein IPdc08_00644 [archaeon]|nr:hypothetical protein IPdc08_00644 [archaeon]
MKSYNNLKKIFHTMLHNSANINMEKLEKISVFLLYLYKKYEGDIEKITATLKKEYGWEKSITSGILYNSELSKKYTFLCQPSQIKNMLFFLKDTPHPVWGKEKEKNGEYIRLPDEKWISLLKMLNNQHEQKVYTEAKEALVATFNKF